MNHLNLVSCSGGKDSTATLLLALKQFPDTTHAVFADTGNEHEATVEYIYYLEQTLGIRIEHVRQDFSDLFARRRNYILTKWPEKGVPMQRCEEAAACLVPSGNPFLDLCMLKGWFPSRKMQFCTQELKTYPLTEIYRRFPEHIERIAKWEAIVRSVSKNGEQASFIPAPGGEGRADRQGRNINEIVRWAMTKRGDLEYNEIYDQPPAACSSAYGLCE